MQAFAAPDNDNDDDVAAAAASVEPIITIMIIIATTIIIIVPIIIQSVQTALMILFCLLYCASKSYGDRPLTVRDLNLDQKDCWARTLPLHRPARILCS